MGHRVFGQREGVKCSDVNANAGFSTLDIVAYCKSSLQTGGNSQRGRKPQELKQMLRSQKCVSPCMCSHLSDLLHQPTTCLPPKLRSSAHLLSIGPKPRLEKIKTLRPLRDHNLSSNSLVAGMVQCPAEAAIAACLAIWRVLFGSTALVLVAQKGKDLIT